MVVGQSVDGGVWPRCAVRGVRCAVRGADARRRVCVCGSSSAWTSVSLCAFSLSRMAIVRSVGRMPGLACCLVACSLAGCICRVQESPRQ